MTSAAQRGSSMANPILSPSGISESDRPSTKSSLFLTSSMSELVTLSLLESLLTSRPEADTLRAQELRGRALRHYVSRSWPWAGRLGFGVKTKRQLSSLSSMYYSPIQTLGLWDRIFSMTVNIRGSGGDSSQT